MNNLFLLKLTYSVVLFTSLTTGSMAHAQLASEQELNETLPIERVIKGKGSSHTQQSVVYYWTDTDGTKHYTDKPQKTHKTHRRVVTTQQPLQHNIYRAQTATAQTPLFAPTPSPPPQFSLPTASANGPLTSDLPPPTSLPPQGLPPLPQDIEGVLRPNNEVKQQKTGLFSDVTSRVL